MPHPDLTFGSSKEHDGDWLAAGLPQVARIMLIAACVCYAIASKYTTFHAPKCHDLGLDFEFDKKKLLQLAA